VERSSSAVAAPIPLLPPVTRAILAADEDEFTVSYASATPRASK
jgi:hypothetical protein